MKPLGKRNAFVRALPWVGIVLGFVLVGYLAATGAPKNAPSTTDQFVAAASTALTTTSTSTTVPRPVHKATQAARVITIRASRGDCWVDAHVTSPAGPTLYRAILHRGRMLTLRARVVWVTFGFAQNVDVRVDGRPQAIPRGTSSIVLRRPA